MLKKMITAFLVTTVVIFTPIFLFVACSITSSESDVGTNSTKVTEEKKEDFVIEGEIETTSEYDSPAFKGLIKNNTNREMEYVQIEITLYDAENNQIGSALDNTSNLKAGSGWKFTAISLDNAKEFDHYEYEITGW